MPFPCCSLCCSRAHRHLQRGQQYSRFDYFFHHHRFYRSAMPTFFFALLLICCFRLSGLLEGQHPLDPRMPSGLRVAAAPLEVASWLPRSNPVPSSTSCCI